MCFFSSISFLIIYLVRNLKFRIHLKYNTIDGSLLQLECNPEHIKKKTQILCRIELICKLFFIWWRMQRNESVFNLDSNAYRSLFANCANINVIEGMQINKIRSQSEHTYSLISQNDCYSIDFWRRFSRSQFLIDFHFPNDGSKLSQLIIINYYYYYYSSKTLSICHRTCLLFHSIPFTPRRYLAFEFTMLN